jgi:hypothetical protein
VGWKKKSPDNQLLRTQPFMRNWESLSLIPSSGQKSSFTLKTEVVYSANFYNPTRRHIQEDSDFHLYRRQNIEYRLGSALFSEICFKSFLHLRPNFSSSVSSSDFLSQTFYASLVCSYFLHVSPILLSKLLHSRSTFKTSPQQSDTEHYQILFVLFQIQITNNKLWGLRYSQRRGGRSLSFGQLIMAVATKRRELITHWRSLQSLYEGKP